MWRTFSGGIERFVRSAQQNCWLGHRLQHLARQVTDQRFAGSMLGLIAAVAGGRSEVCRTNLLSGSARPLIGAEEVRLPPEVAL